MKTAGERYDILRQAGSLVEQVRQDDGLWTYIPASAVEGYEDLIAQFDEE